MKILFKRSSVAGVVPAVNDLIQGEIAINIADGKLFTLSSTNQIIELGAISSGSGAVDSVNGKVGIVVLNADDIASGLTNKYLNQTNLNTMLNTNDGIENLFSIIFNQTNLDKLFDGIGNHDTMLNDFVNLLTDRLGYITNSYLIDQISNFDINNPNDIGSGIFDIGTMSSIQYFNSLERIDCGTF